MEKLEESGCGIGKNFIKARGGLLRWIHQGIWDQVEEQVMIHELIHAYDDCRGANLHWNNRAHHACSEIRANHLSGNYELLRGYECVKPGAMQSVTANPYCSEVAAKEAIEAVWSTCYNDTKPFDRA
ncbi:hypothetical protein SASPL_108732 [Salvia splendens]|uniref:Mitochondrial inner membrane protease ATP23 n=1 Tax=Salvia splendens TaxID=180675 RepID=A0A8X8YEZ9_SALSN|nr:hypothetical protein SASPL_108732 [Salvia splendens]